MSATLYHLALASQWSQAREDGEYAISTLQARIDEVGFLHACADLDQVAGVHRRFYRQVREPLLLLSIDQRALEQHGYRVRFEAAVPADPTGELFPHVYGGNLPIDAVVEVRAYPLTPESA